MYKRVGGANKKIFDGSSIGYGIYSTWRADCLSNFNVEYGGDEEVDVGASITCSTNNAVHTVFPHIINKNHLIQCIKEHHI